MSQRTGRDRSNKEKQKLVKWRQLNVLFHLLFWLFSQVSGATS